MLVNHIIARQRFAHKCVWIHCEKINACAIQQNRLQFVGWSHACLPEMSMFSGYALSKPPFQTHNTWKEPALISMIFLLDRQRMAVCCTISYSPYRLLFPPAVIEAGGMPGRVRSEAGGEEEEEGQKQRQPREGLLSFTRQNLRFFLHFLTMLHWEQ